MIYSMTAFSRIQTQDSNYNLTCEMRSINHRYLEVGLYLPEVIRALEMQIREEIRKHVKRGKIECVIRYQQYTSADSESTLTVNVPLAKTLCQASEQIASYLKSPADPIPTDILRYPGVLETKEIDLAQLQTVVKDLIEKSINDLIAARGREGEQLKVLFLQRMDAIMEELGKVRERLPQVLTDQRERLYKRFADAKVELDPNRLEQEMVLFAQRIDIAEEIERTETHVNEIRRVLKHGGMVGRRLDFLLQELNREANTMGSKSTDSVITHAAVEMKVLIEQVREQVQNIE